MALKRVLFRAPSWKTAPHAHVYRRSSSGRRGPSPVSNSPKGGRGGRGGKANHRRPLATDPEKPSRRQSTDGYSPPKCLGQEASLRPGVVRQRMRVDAYLGGWVATGSQLGLTECGRPKARDHLEPTRRPSPSVAHAAKAAALHTKSLPPPRRPAHVRSCNGEREYLNKSS